MLEKRPPWVSCVSVYLLRQGLDSFRSGPFVKDVCTAKSLGTQTGSPFGREQICFLTRIIRVMSPSRTKIGQVCWPPLQRFGVSLAQCPSAVMQTHRVRSNLLYCPRGLWRTKGTNADTKLLLPAVLGAIESVASEPGVLWPLPASMKMWQTNFSACK